MQVHLLVCSTRRPSHRCTSLRELLLETLHHRWPSMALHRTMSRPHKKPWRARLSHSQSSRTVRASTHRLGMTRRHRTASGSVYHLEVRCIRHRMRKSTLPQQHRCIDCPRHGSNAGSRDCWCTPWPRRCHRRTLQWHHKCDAQRACSQLHTRNHMSHRILRCK